MFGKAESSITITTVGWVYEAQLSTQFQYYYLIDFGLI